MASAVHLCRAFNNYRRGPGTKRQNILRTVPVILVQYSIRIVQYNKLPKLHPAPNAVLGVVVDAV